MKKNTKITELEQFMKEQREQVKQKKAKIAELQGQLAEIDVAKTAAQMSGDYDAFVAKEAEAAEIDKQIAFLSSFTKAVEAGNYGASDEDVKTAWSPRAAELTADLAEEFKKVLDAKLKYLGIIYKYAEKVYAAKAEYSAARKLLPKNSSVKLAKVKCADTNDINIGKELSKAGEIDAYSITGVLRLFMLAE